MSTASAESRGPTVILIGGPMTVDDGTFLDSRQQIEGDARSEVTRRALATSQLWWNAASSVVMPILESAGPGAFALVVGQRSVIEVRPDGSTRRSLLRKLLPNGVTTDRALRCSSGESQPQGFEEVDRVPSLDGQDDQTTRRKPGDPAARWHLLDGNVYVPTKTLGPAVVVDTDAWSIFDEYELTLQFESLEQGRLYNADCVLVVPHTWAAEVFFQRYLAWNAQGRPPGPDDDRGPIDVQGPAPPDPISYAVPVPIAATFGVTGHIEKLQWLDPSDLEAARSLLEARYDLKIGIWDLVENSTLRQSLLDTSPVSPAPAQEAPVPAGSGKRAQARVESKIHQREELTEAIQAVAVELRPLADLGWRLAVGIHRRMFRLPLMEAPRVPSDDPPEVDDFAQPEGIVSLLHIDLTVSKASANVSAYSTLYGEIDVGAYAEAHRSILEQIASPEKCSLGEGRPSLWHVSPGLGPGADWTSRTTVLQAITPRWIEAFSELAEECRQVRLSLGHPL